MKLPIMFFRVNLLTTAIHLLVFPRKNWKNIGFYWNSTGRRASHGGLVPCLAQRTSAKYLEMSRLPNSLTIFTLLIICLCMVSVWIAPAFLETGRLVMEFTETDSDPFEFEEDLFLVNYGADGIIRPVNLRIGATRLNRNPASLARVFSPPRPFSS